MAVVDQERLSVKSSVGEDQEIYLADVVRYTKRNIRLLFTILTVFFIPFLLYAFTATKVFRAEIYLSPPSLRYFNQFNVYALSGYVPELELHTADSVFGRFINNVRSRETQWDFFVKSSLYNSYKEAGYGNGKRQSYLDGFRRNIVVTDLGKGFENTNGATIRNSYEFQNQSSIRSILSEFIEYAKQKTIEEILSDMEVEREIRTDGLRRKIEKIKRLAKSTQNDSLTVLKEALSIANQLGLKTNEGIQFRDINNGSDISVNTSEIPLYMRGSLALEAEINAINARESEDPFVGRELRILQENLYDLDRMSIDKSEVSPVYIVQEVEKIGLVYPNVFKILIVGAIVSLFSSFVGLWLRHVFNIWREID